MKGNGTTEVRFTVPGIPRPGGSKRAFLHAKTQKMIVMDECRENKNWRSTVALFSRQSYAGPWLDGPLELHVVFRMPRPKAHYGTGSKASTLRQDAPEWHTSKPDATKLLRALEDALTCVLWHDDSQVVYQVVQKRYADGEPGADVVVRQITGGEKKCTTGR